VPYITLRGPLLGAGVRLAQNREDRLLKSVGRYIPRGAAYYNQVKTLFRNEKKTPSQAASGTSPLIMEATQEVMVA